jgi:hypothetical protein
LDLTGLINSVINSVHDIDLGREGFTINGREHEGRLFYEAGITRAAESFQTAQTTADPQTIILVELAFLQQELQFCGEEDTDTRSSLIQAIQSFDDALRSLEAVKDAGYKIAEKTYPTTGSKFRIQGFPKDACHTACIAHITRLRNILRSPGSNMTEKAVLKQRIENMSAAQRSYLQLQRKVLSS